ncbi:MAG: hypothetical protein GXP63_03660 [DPANN group archaeon]|nr:hypothetical protein [DPANN group archaeon]
MTTYKSSLFSYWQIYLIIVIVFLSTFIIMVPVRIDGFLILFSNIKMFGLLMIWLLVVYFYLSSISALSIDDEKLSQQFLFRKGISISIKDIQAIKECNLNPVNRAVGSAGLIIGGLSYLAQYGLLFSFSDGQKDFGLPKTLFAKDWDRIKNDLSIKTGLKITSVSQITGR